MKTAQVLILFGFLESVWCSCYFSFDKESKECAQPYGFKEIQVFEYLNSGYNSTEAPNVNSFVECLWRKWGFLNDNGE
ncbi:hypothetical protein FQR65_LT12618 [Abscondita terminalis]|nr:hypothetical protein FQR65_LT12618 [Abscondita terminalis]